VIEVFRGQTVSANLTILVSGKVIFAVQAGSKPAMQCFGTLRRNTCLGP
jgi:hypothetical protein